LGNSHGNFQLHRFTTSENIAKSFRGGLLFLTHTVYPTGLSLCSNYGYSRIFVIFHI